MADWIPGISQLKSAVQACRGDFEGARETQENFIRKCPGVSHVAGATAGIVGVLADDREALRFAKEAIAGGTKTISDVADGIPVVGHLKGAGHLMFNDRDGAARAVASANRTTALVGFTIGAPVGAIGAGIAHGIHAVAGRDEARGTMWNRCDDCLQNRPQLVYIR